MKNIKNNIKINIEKIKINWENYKSIFLRSIENIDLEKNAFVHLGENPIPRITKYCLTKDRP
jgi:hypothetical protein